MSAAKQPWSVGNVCLDDTIVTAVVDCDGDEICNMGNSLMDEGANAEHIVACVNDYAALEARCAGLERERDALQQKYTDLKTAAQATNASLVGLGFTRLALEDRAKDAEQERDALQAKLATYESHGPDGHNATNAQYVEVRDKLEAAEEALKNIASGTWEYPRIAAAGFLGLCLNCYGRGHTREAVYSSYNPVRPTWQDIRCESCNGTGRDKSKEATHGTDDVR